MWVWGDETLSTTPARGGVVDGTNSERMIPRGEMETEEESQFFSLPSNTLIIYSSFSIFIQKKSGTVVVFARRATCAVRDHECM